MMRHTTWLAAPSIALLTACGSVHSAEDPGEPIAVVTATLTDAPSDVGDTGPLRAALVWTNGLGFSDPNHPNSCTSTAQDLTTRFAECEQQLRENVVITTSDVEVEMEFPLTVSLAMFDLPTPVLQHIEGGSFEIQEPDGSIHGITGDFYTLPEAEVVLYEDGNGNEKLDLLPIGVAGPGPDRVVALSSGVNDDGDAVRTAVVYKAGQLPWWVSGYAALLDNPETEQPAPPNGIYAYRVAYGPEDEILQQRVLSRHALTGSSVPFSEELPKASNVEPIATATIELFTVGAERRSWLSRGCERMLTLGGVVAPGLPPPDGADVQCGAGALAFASHPDNYCGQSDIVMVEYGAAAPAWWPCDEHGLKQGTPYHATHERLDGDPTWWGNLPSLGFGTAISGLAWRCHEGVIYHFDRMPFFRMPTVGPTPGSQVMCHSSDALSFIPPRADGCLFKYRVDLASDPTWPSMLLRSEYAWDMRSSRPDWWPCDENGELIADSGMVPPEPPADADCEGFDPYVLTEIAPPEGSAIQCESAIEFSFVPPWSDACDPKQRFATSYSDENSSGTISKPEWWPCDDDGQFIPSAHFVAAE